MRKIEKQIGSVREQINAQLLRERSDLGRVGIGMQREGFVGGYLQALNDVQAAMRGYTDANSRFQHLWDQP